MQHGEPTKLEQQNEPKRQLVTRLQSLYVFGLSNIHFLQRTGHMEHTSHYQ